MKRRDMVMAILRALAELDVMYPYVKQADHILKRIEEAGMVPKQVKFLATDEIVKIDRNFNPLYDYDCEFSWEPEE